MKDNQSNPFIGMAKFLITLGLVMIVAKLDLLSLGEISDYFLGDDPYLLRDLLAV